MAYGLLLLRVVFGLTIAAHGAQKVFGWFDGGGLKRWGTIFGANYKNGVLMAALAGMSELGGVAFAIGLFTPIAALGMVVVMVTAIRVVTWKNGFFHSKGGFEFNLALLAGAVAIVMTGPGGSRWITRWASTTTRAASGGASASSRWASSSLSSTTRSSSTLRNRRPQRRDADGLEATRDPPGCSIRARLRVVARCQLRGR